MPLVERLTIGSRSGAPVSVLAIASGEGVSATFFAPRLLSTSYIKPRRHPHVFDVKGRQTQDQFHRQRKQYADGEKLESHILQQARARENLFVQSIARHQPMEKHPADDVERADHYRAEDDLQPHEQIGVVLKVRRSHAEVLVQ